jgi:hypothetical protein
VHQTYARQRRALSARAGQHDRQVFLLVLDGEGRREVTRDHLLAQHVERPRLGRPARQRRVQRLQRQPRALREGQALGHRRQVERHDDLVDRLAQLSCARRPQQRDALAHRLQHRARALDGRSLTADEVGERALDGALLAA